LGLTGAGFEANAADLAGKGATIGSTAGSGAASDSGTITGSEAVGSVSDLSIAQDI